MEEINIGRCVDFTCMAGVVRKYMDRIIFMGRPLSEYDTDLLFYKGHDEGIRLCDISLIGEVKPGEKAWIFWRIYDDKGEVKTDLSFYKVVKNIMDKKDARDMLKEIVDKCLRVIE